MIQTRNLSYGYSQTKKVLNNITLDIREGHIYGLLGKNGVGKSTVLKLMCGLLDSGKGAKAPILVDGHNPRHRDVELLQLIRFVGENEAVPDMTVHKWAEVTAPFYPTFDFKMLDKALSDFEIPAEQPLTQMSLGQQKKSVIAMALACNTKYLLMDEPTNGMDIPSKAIFRRLIAEYMTDEKTIIISTHQVDDIESLIDAVIILKNTAVLLNATIQEIGTQFRFGHAEEGDEIIYTEPTLFGDISMVKNKTGEESPVDLKVLFTALTGLTPALPGWVESLKNVPPTENSSESNLNPPPTENSSESNLNPPPHRGRAGVGPLLKYDLAENGKAYAQAIGIAFLVYFFLTGFIYYINSPIEPYEAQNYIEWSAGGAIVAAIVFYFLATSNLIVNRYCEARTATIYNMLPASNFEKGCLVFLQLILFAFVVPVIFYVICYTVVYLAMLALGFGADIYYHLRLDFWTIYEELWHTHSQIEFSEKDLPLYWFLTIGYTLLPVSCAISSTIYHIMVTFYRNKRVQIKALFTYFVYINAISWILSICGFTIASLAAEGYMDWFEDLALNHPGYIFGTFDVLVLCQIPVLGALLRWFFKRLHYKEIR